MKNNNLPDTQSNSDNRNILINKAGIKNILHPINFINAKKENCPSIGKFTMAVSLPANTKGTHMSRFIEILNEKECTFSIQNFSELINRVSNKLESDNAYVDVQFTFFKKKLAPSSKSKGFIDYQITLSGSLTNNVNNLLTKVLVPVTSLCPCSKSISKYGAHNQRSHITIQVKVKDINKFNIEYLIDLAEKKASCELYPILKRADEKLITERAYENPAFVEDIVRDIAIELNNNENIYYYCVESENFESIHNHSAYAVIEKQK